VALQLMACGNASTTAEEREQRESARPVRAAADAVRPRLAGEPEEEGAASAIGTATTPAAAISDDESAAIPVDEPEAMPVDEPVAAVLEDPVTAPADEPAMVPEAGWDAPHCAGAATRHVRVEGNLDAVMATWQLEFSAENPWNTSVMGTSFTAFDDQGRAQMIWVYFVPVAQGWDYHAVMDGTAFVIGEGHLSFDDQGVATVEEHRALRLLTANGPGNPVELDLDGMTQLNQASTVTWQEVDGSEARWGTACAASDPVLPVGGPSCSAVATTQIALRANLAAATPVSEASWNALAPNADFSLPLQANDDQGAPIDFQLALLRVSADAWDYHVLSSGQEPYQEVASGTLSFNPNGSLGSVATGRVLRFPNHDGRVGAAIELDFGAPTANGGSGLDGVTLLPGGSLAIWQQGNGAALDCLPRATRLAPGPRAPSCAGERTTAVSMNFNLDPSTALSDAVAYSSSVTVYDASLAPQLLELNFHHVEPGYWQCQVVAANAEAGVFDLHFAENGGPELIENIPLVRLPLADESAGPPIELGFDSGWPFTSFASESQGWLTPNGAPPGADGCVN